jgi:hypothetical protein
MALVTDLGADLVAKLRGRVMAGSPFWEIGMDSVPDRLREALAGAEPEAVFASRHAVVAVLTDGRRLCCRLNAYT